MVHTNADKRKIVDQALSLGFTQIGFSKAVRLDEQEAQLSEWLNKGYHGKMAYMENHFEMRLDPRKLVPGSKTVISLLFNYFPAETQKDPSAPKIARYAYGEDYHFVLKDKLKSLMHFIEDEIAPVNGRCFVDSAPVMERTWAHRSGLGWLGKNTLLIHPKKGSYFFLAELIIDLAFEQDDPIKDHCGTCTKCIDACPTDAISPSGYLLDASKCISYFTIELKEAIPTEHEGKFENWMFGCDICQEVCPWNRFSKEHNEVSFVPKKELMEMNKNEWLEITEEVFKKVFRKSPVKRTKYEGLKRNIQFLSTE